MELLLATSNLNKVRELQMLLQDTDWEIKSLRDFPDIVMPPENATTFEGNATLKGRVGAVASGLWTIADDSGLEVDWLNGKPGVYSARYAGEEKDDKKNNQKLIANLKDCPDTKRQGRFVSVIVLVSPDGDVYKSEGICEGIIGRAEKGDFGFGYDPLFIIEDLGKTMAEISMEEKNQISHRAKALAGILEILASIE